MQDYSVTLFRMNRKTNKLHGVLMNVGASCGCHQMPERSFFWHGYQFPICSRCFGVAIGYLIGGVVFIWKQLPIYVCVFLCFLMFVDWFIQRIGIFESTNLRRLLTGIGCGIGYFHLVVQTVIIFIQWLNK